MATWFFVSLKPDDANGFFEGVAIASITALYEYIIMYLDAEDKGIQITSIIGIAASIIYFAGAILGFAKLIVFNVSDLVMTFGNKMPIPLWLINRIGWSYYYVVIFMGSFPLLIVVQSWLKRKNEAMEIEPETPAM